MWLWSIHYVIHYIITCVGAVNPNIGYLNACNYGYINVHEAVTNYYIITSTHTYIGQLTHELIPKLKYFETPYSPKSRKFQKKVSIITHVRATITIY